MRTNEERIAAMHQRAAHIKKVRNVQLFSVAAVLLCAILNAVFLPATAMPKLETIPSGVNASIFYETNHLVSVVIAVVSFLLGVSVTILCFYIKKVYERDGR